MIPQNGAQLSLDPTITVPFSWKNFGNDVVEVVANFALKGWADGGVSGLVALGRTLIGASVEVPTNAKAWRLVALCFASTVDDLKSKETVDIQALRNVLREG